LEKLNLILIQGLGINYSDAPKLYLPATTTIILTGVRGHIVVEVTSGH